MPAVNPPAASAILPKEVIAHLSLKTPEAEPRSEYSHFRMGKFYGSVAGAIVQKEDMLESKGSNDDR